MERDVDLCRISFFLFFVPKMTSMMGNHRHHTYAGCRAVAMAQIML